MDSLLASWRALGVQRRVLLLAAVAATMAAVVALGQIAGRPGMALLYSGLDPAAAGEVLGAIEQMQVASEVRGDAIYVDEAARDRVRLTLARSGLPRQGQEGYELLDRISGFSATTDMFDAAYWRAREGELARTILASPRVRAARVHLAAPSRRAFARGADGPTASVTVTMAGASVTETEATAFRYLVALAVSGLAPEQVGVIDSRAGVVLAPGTGTPVQNALGDARTREVELKAAVERLLAARVGPDSARVSVSVEVDRTGETLTERILDPDSRVTIHSDTQETTETAAGGDPAVTVASNLPEGDAAGANGRTSSRSETREMANYDYSETRREKVRQPGAIRRLSVAVLVDGITGPGPDGAPVWQPRPPEELAALRQLVIAAVGHDEARGDIVTVESMAFQAEPPDDGLLEADPVGRFLERNGLALVQIAALTGVVLLLVLMVLRPILLRPAPAVAAEPALTGPEGAAIALAAPAGGDATPGGDALPDALFSLPDRATLRDAVTNFPEQSVETLRDWLDGPEEEAR